MERDFRDKDVDEVVFGYFPKDEAVALVVVLKSAAVDSEIGFDRDFARLHASATSVRPILRRGSTFGDVRSGYFVSVPAGQAQAAEAAISGTRFAYLLEEPAEPPQFPSLEREAGGPIHPSGSGMALWVTIALAVTTLAVMVVRFARAVRY